MFRLDRDDLYRLKGNTPEEDNLIVALLRNYSGLFTGLKFIDEALLAQITHTTVPLVYLTLKSLAQKNIIQFIPQRCTPYIRYAQRREDSQYLVFAPDVYDNLKERFAKRISAMTAYATNDGVCRSRALLAYFGETDSHDCGHCDVCISHGVRPPKAEATSDGSKPQTTEEAMRLILEALADGKPHPISILRRIPADYHHIDKALLALVSEERLIDDDGMISLAGD